MAQSDQTFTLNAVVTEVMNRSGRRDRIYDIVSYVNQTLKECNSLAFFEKSTVEDQITAATDNYIWPKPRLFKEMRTVLYPLQIYPKYMVPGKVQYDQRYYYYYGPTYVVFAGTTAGELISINYFKHIQRLKYWNLDTENQPAYWDAVADNGVGAWYYWDGSAYVTTLGDDDLEEAARDAVSNWLLIDYYDSIIEGTLAKIYKSINDDRAAACYALYKQHQDIIVRSEPSGDKHTNGRTNR